MGRKIIASTGYVFDSSVFFEKVVFSEKKKSKKTVVSQILNDKQCQYDRFFQLGLKEESFNNDVFNNILKTLKTQKEILQECSRAKSKFYQDRTLFDAFVTKYGINIWFKACSINNSHWKKVQRVEDKITPMVETGRCCFLTMTFNDACLASTKNDIRRKYITRFLKETCLDYVANIDYGDKKEREHYHANAVFRNEFYKSNGELDFSKIVKVYGEYTHNSVVKIKLVPNNELDAKRTSKYICKFVNHAMKATTIKKCIYCRLPEIDYTKDVDLPF